MELRTASSPRDVKHYDTARLREEFLIRDLFPADDVKMVYSHIDRIITGGCKPVEKTLTLAAGDELLAEPAERPGDDEKDLDEKPREPVDGRPAGHDDEGDREQEDVCDFSGRFHD